MKRRYELTATGIDDALIGMSSDPWSQGAPQAEGLRVPPVVEGAHGIIDRPRFLFCLATRVIMKPCRLVGIRQGVTIGMDLANGTPPFRPIELFVTTPSFKFSDGNISWHLVYEDNARPTPHELDIRNTNNWMFEVSDGPAMLYETFTNGVVGPNGDPLLYMRNLTAYTPPQLQLTWKPVAEDLKCFYGLRFPYMEGHAWADLGGEGGIELEVGRRVSLYASVLQSNPATRPADVAPTLVGGVKSAPQGIPPEEAFISVLDIAAGGELPAVGPVYWRVMGGLVFEDYLGEATVEGSQP